jgi:hypothetical protein
MSHMALSKTVFRDRRALVKALKTLCPDATIEVHDVARTFRNFYGQQTEQAAEVVVRKGRTGPQYADAGFVKQKDGTYAMVMDNMESQFQERTKTLAQRYAREVVVAQQLYKGYRMVSEKQREDGSKV